MRPDFLMRYMRLLILFCWLPLTFVLPNCAVAVTADGAPVRVLLFYSNTGCAECSDLFAYYVPGLLERQGAHLEIAGLDVDRTEGALLYQAATAQYSLRPVWDGVPVALAGQRVMRGLNEIGSVLGDELEGLSREPASQQWPSLPGLVKLLPSAIQDIRIRVAERGPLPPLPSATGNSAHSSFANALARALAIVVLLGMLVVLGGSVWRVWRGAWHGRSGDWRIWTGVAVGLGISGYTAFTSLADIAPVCGPIGDCVAVQHSEYARLFGIPMGVLGLLGYTAILVCWILGRRLTPAGGGWRWLPWGITLAGCLFSLRLTALEIFVIGATCLWCLGSAVTISLLLWLLSGETRRV
jgi:uncharacterized membrane protein